MKLQEFLNENGPRKTATKLVEIRIFRIMGLSMQDLPDSTQLWDIVDELESLLEECDFKMETIKDLLNEITFEFIEEICW
jgi:hypothetical protein